MPRKNDERICYSRKELAEWIGIDEKNVSRELEKICDIYGLSLGDFKKEKDNHNSDYIFSPEVAELLVILIKNRKFHPSAKRANAKLEKKLASSVADYNCRVLDDIDKIKLLPVKYGVYGRPGHIVAENIADWTKAFVKQLTFFIFNITTLKNQDVGTALCQFTKKMDEMNYCLYTRDKFLKDVYDEEQTQNYPDYPEPLKYINTHTISIDVLLAGMIRGFLTNKKERYDNSADDHTHYDDEACMCARDIDYETREATIRALRKMNSEWEDTAARIKAGSFVDPFEKSSKDKKEIIQQSIQYYEMEIARLKEELEYEENATEGEEGKYIKELKNSYPKHCEEIEADKRFNELYEIVDRFVGRALLKLMQVEPDNNDKTQK